MPEEELIDDLYQPCASIATGSSSHVLEVVEKSSGRHLAMKLLKKDVPEFKANKVQLKRESEILKSLDHPLIVKFAGFSSNRDHTYMLMEHFRAANLKVQIKSETNKVHVRIRSLFEGICTALSHVHQRGYIHRDIKPDNILLNRVGEVRLCDFSLSSRQKKGIGKMLAGRLKSIQGTRTYIAPETIRRHQPTIQTDMYSLGVLLYEALTCRTPFQAPTPEELLHKHLKAEAPNPSEYNPNVTPEMDRIIAKLLKKKPVDRPASVDEVLAELKRIRIFKEDVIDEALTKQATEDANFIAMASEARLDSRADAKLKRMLETNVEFAEKFLSEKKEKERKRKVEKELTRKRIEAAEDGKAKKAASSPTAAKAAAPPPPPQPIPMMPQPMPMPMPMMPMQMPGYPPGYPQGFGAYPQPPMSMMPMQPGMNPPMPGAMQFPGQPQAAFPQPVQPVPAPAAISTPPAARPAGRPQDVQNPVPAERRPQPAPPKPQAPAPAARQPAVRHPQPAPQTPAPKQTPPASPARQIPSPISRPVARATPASRKTPTLST